jgi:Holliday junction resolvase RusA-like endonuclease
MIEFFVFGTPAPQGSKRAYVVPGPGVGSSVRMEGGARWVRNPITRLVDGGSATEQAATKGWRKAVRETAEKWIAGRPGWEPLDEPLRIQLRFSFDPPASDPYRTRHAVKPDKDKLVRAVFDALADAGIVVNDSRFFWVEVSAFFARPDDAVGVGVRIIPCGDLEAAEREALKAEAREARRRVTT